MDATANKPKPKPYAKLAALAGLIAVAAFGYASYGESLSLENLAAQENVLRAYQLDHPILVYGVAFMVYVTITGLSLPGAVPLTLLYGWYFGWLNGTIVVSFASTTGATIAFLLSRYFFRDAIQSRFGDKLKSFNESLEREGPFFLFTLRMIPLVPFFVINAVMGLTPMKVRTFWWVSQVGMLAGTAVYVYAGSSVPTLAELSEKGAKGIVSVQLLIALGLLGVLPLAARYAIGQFQKTRTNQNAAVN